LNLCASVPSLAGADWGRGKQGVNMLDEEKISTWSICVIIDWSKMLV
jgi:hypothetical protein